MDGKEEWEGTATELLEALSELPSVNEKDKAWPKRPNTLTRKLNKINLRWRTTGLRYRQERITGQQPKNNPFAKSREFIVIIVISS
ncbi:MAG: hypothetical protein RJR37_10475 [Peptococcaceae bacterium MAG4]|nr:hypothetical protein [Peptococcaceae bacterium MAG4]